MQFYSQLNTYSYPAPTQQGLTWNRQHWATQSLTVGTHLNASWNCLPSKPNKRETLNCKRGGQYFTRSGFLCGETHGVTSQPVEYYNATGNTGVIEEENSLSKPKMWQQCCILAKPWASALQSATCGSPTLVDTTTKTSKLQKEDLDWKDLIWALNTHVHSYIHSKPTCTIHVTWGRSSPRAATSFKINKETNSVKMLQSIFEDIGKARFGIAIRPGNYWLCKQEFYMPSLGRDGLKVRNNVEGFKPKEYC